MVTLIRLRDKAGLSKRQLALEAGTKPEYVAGYEYGDQRPGCDMIARLAGVLAYHLDEDPEQVLLQLLEDFADKELARWHYERSRLLNKGISQ